MELSADRMTLALLGALIVAASFVPLLRAPAQRFALVDHPDRRKKHADPTPMTGGVSVSLGVLIGLLIAFGPDWNAFWSLPAGAAVLLTLGLADDVHPLSAVLRLLVQLIVAAVLVLGAGLQLESLGMLFGSEYGPVTLGPLSVLFSILCVAFLVNAVNMTDGLDGLAGGMSFIVLVLFGVVALLDGAALGLIALPLIFAAALAGFLPFNVRSPLLARARAFLGDSGSMMLGYIMAWFAIAFATRDGAGVPPIVIAWLLAVPAMDTLALFCRRLLQRRSPLSPDRAHLHHLLQRSGHSVSGAVHRIHIAVFSTGVFGIVGWQLGLPEWLSFVLLAVLMLSYIAAVLNAPRLLRAVRRRRRTVDNRRQSKGVDARYHAPEHESAHDQRGLG